MAETSGIIMTDNEYNYPTVKQGSKAILVFTAAIICRMMVFGATNELNAALAALLTALTGTHTVLVIGGGFNNSRWASPQVPGVTETTKITETKTVADTSSLAQDKIITDSKV